jgi:signal peptidase I
LAERFQQRQRGLQIGAGGGQCRGSGWCDLGSMTPPSTTPTAKESSKGFWRNLIVWALLALLLRWWVVEPRWIPSGSMLPTLQLQDRILVEKIRPRLTRRLHRHLQRGDVVVFAPPPQLVAAGYDPNAALIKRVVGLPGDELMVDNGVLLRNGEEVSEPWLKEAMDYAMAPVQVPDDQLWVMGDNRNASLDSHLWGPLPERNVIGTAIWRYWPLQEFGPLRIPAPGDGS